MLKKLIPFCLIIVSPFVGSAQIPVLTSSTDYIAGDTYRQYLMYPTDTFYISSSGPAQTWILGYDFAVGVDSEYYTICSANIYCDSFPGTTVCGQGLWFGSSVFYNETPSTLSVDGEYDTTLTVYSNYMDILRYPFTYNSTYVDTFTAKYIKDSFIYYRYGTINVTGDAYGSMVTTWGDTLNNTIRVHSIKNYFDSSVGLGVVYTYVEESYAWYVPDYRGAFVTQTNKTTNGISTSHMSYFNDKRKYTTSIPINNIQLGIESYPNPATTSLTITSANKITNVTITNLVGQTVYTHSCNSEKVQVDVSGLPTDIYFVKVNGSEVRKFVKE